MRTHKIHTHIDSTSVPARSFASDTYIYCTQKKTEEEEDKRRRQKKTQKKTEEEEEGRRRAEEESVGVCDRRTILLCPVLGVFCDATQQRNDANSQIIVLID